MVGEKDEKIIMAKFGLIGKSLEHSFSASFFKNKFANEDLKQHTYDNFELDKPSDILDLIESNPNLEGLNVTVPYKETIMPFLSSLENKAESIGAVNVIKINRNKEKPFLKGFNTDADAFKRTLDPLLKNIHKKAIILGRGGASKAVGYAFEQMGIETIYISRRPLETNGNYMDNVISYSDLSPSIIKDHLIIVNTTPLGMYPDLNSLPKINYDVIGKEHILYDLVYNPKETEFLKKGKKENSKIKNGLEMLQVQAEMSWNIWQGKGIT